MVTVQHRRRWDELHLLGGLRAGTHREGHLYVCPCATKGQVLTFPQVTDTRDYYRTIKSIGLDLLGHDEHQINDDGEPSQSIWYQFDLASSRKSPSAGSLTGRLRIVDTWSGISNTCRNSGRSDTAELAKHIAFGLRACELRLRDCSSEYLWQNEYAVFKGTHPGGRFSNLKSFDLDLALHSLLTEMGTARDYLAHFISRFIFQDPKPVDAMAALYKRIKKRQPSNTSASQEVADEVMTICDPERAEGWMAKLTEYRNIIIHRAPLSGLSKHHFLTAERTAVGDTSLVRIFFPIPADPFTNDAVASVDALTHFLDFQRRLRGFARLIADCSGVAPTLVHITDKDIIRPEGAIT